jgi:catechol 2,3-dioxygenase-like lactoylglutathione lyase family enzyme
MSERTEYANGEFCWVELISPDVKAAARFYGDLLGWERERYEPDPEGYWYLRRGGKLVAGLEGIRTEGQVPTWLGYVGDDRGQGRRRRRNGARRTARGSGRRRVAGHLSGRTWSGLRTLASESARLSHLKMPAAWLTSWSLPNGSQA